jgi:hypothetical protein
MEEIEFSGQQNKKKCKKKKKKDLMWYEKYARFRIFMTTGQ